MSKNARTRRQAAIYGEKGERTAAAGGRSGNVVETVRENEIEKNDLRNDRSGGGRQPVVEANLSETLGSNNGDEVCRETAEQQAAAGDRVEISVTPNGSVNHSRGIVCRRHDDVVDVLEEDDARGLSSLGLLGAQHMAGLGKTMHCITGGPRDEEEDPRSNNNEESAMGGGRSSGREGSLKDVILFRNPCSSRRQSLEEPSQPRGRGSQSRAFATNENEDIEVAVPNHDVGAQDSGRPPQTNASFSFVNELSEPYQARVLKAIEKLSENVTKHLNGIREDMQDIKNVLLCREIPSADAEKKKNTSRIDSVEDMLSQKLPGFRKAFNKGTFCPVIFGQVVRIVVKEYMPASSSVSRTGKLMDIIMFSTKDGKAMYDTEVGRATKTLRRAIVNSSIANARADMFGMFSDMAAAGNIQSDIPHWLTDASICDLSSNNVEIGCVRHEQKSQRAAAKRVLSMVRGEIEPNNSELGQFVGHSIYGSVMDMFVFGRKNSRIVIFEEVGYVLRNWAGCVHNEITSQSLKMQWKAAAKSTEVSCNLLPYASTISEAAVDIDRINRLKLKKLVDEQEHLQLIVRHDVSLRDKVKDSQETTDTFAAANKKTWTRTLSLIHVSLRYLSSFSNFEKKADAITVLKYDKYSIMAAYRLAVAFRRVIDVKSKGQIRSPDGEDGHEASSTMDGAAASAEEVRIVNKICDEMLTPSACEVVRAFDRNVNSVNAKFYDDENDENLMFIDELESNLGAECANGGRQSLTCSMDVDLEL